MNPSSNSGPDALHFYPVDSTLANISTRGFVDAGDNVMIGGVIIGGVARQVLVCAIGPELTIVSGGQSYFRSRDHGVSRA